MASPASRTSAPSSRAKGTRPPGGEKERKIKAKATLQISGDRYASEGSALVGIEKREEGFFFSWKAQDSAGTEIAQDSKLVLFRAVHQDQYPEDSA